MRGASLCSAHQTHSGNPSMSSEYNLQVLEQLETQSFPDRLFMNPTALTFPFYFLGYHSYLFTIKMYPRILARLFMVMNKSLIWGLILKDYGKETTPHFSKRWKITCLMVDFHQSAGRLRGALS